MQIAITVALLAAAASAIPLAPGYDAAGYAAPVYAPMPFTFGYNVKDDYGNNYGHESKSDGVARHGSYHVALPDGRLQVVNYHAGPHGYVADVNYKGQAVHPGSHGHY